MPVAEADAIEVPVPTRPRPRLAVAPAPTPPRAAIMGDGASSTLATGPWWAGWAGWGRWAVFAGGVPGRPFGISGGLPGLLPAVGQGLPGLESHRQNESGEESWTVPHSPSLKCLGSLLSCRRLRQRFKLPSSTTDTAFSKSVFVSSPFLFLILPHRHDSRAEQDSIIINNTLLVGTTRYGKLDATTKH